jgi:uncharacterized protein (DUF1810 family)
MSDPYDLQRFLDAQEAEYEEAYAELQAGSKRGHWMWFIFPQLRGLGHSFMANKFGIGSLDEARAYLGHAVLGPRLIACTQLVNLVQGRSIEQVLGHIDAMKFRSSMTLFAGAAAENGVFVEALRKYFDGKPDRLTLERL